MRALNYRCQRRTRGNVEFVEDTPQVAQLRHFVTAPDERGLPVGHKSNIAPTGSSAEVRDSLTLFIRDFWVTLATISLLTVSQLTFLTKSLGRSVTPRQSRQDQALATPDERAA